MDSPNAPAKHASAHTTAANADTTAHKPSASRSGVSTAALGAFGLAALVSMSASAAPPPTERVRGFFCSEKQHSVDFLTEQARGENEEMAANAVNKRAAKLSCAYFLPANAIYTGDHTVMSDGMVFKLQSFVFLPEKVERWTGSALGSLQPVAGLKHDV
jgi:hypothetical protein